MELKILTPNGENGYARYIKQADGNWKHSGSNVSADSMVSDIASISRN